MTDSDHSSGGMVQSERQLEDTVCAIADALQGDDEVIINGRARTLEVLGRDEQPNPGVIKTTDYPYRIVWLRGNGTEYRLRYSHLGEYYPRLHTESELETRESWSVKHQEKRIKTTAKAHTGKRVRRISVEGVDDDDLADWALIRNIRGLSHPETEGNSLSRDTGTDRDGGEDA